MRPQVVAVVLLASCSHPSSAVRPEAPVAKSAPRTEPAPAATTAAPPAGPAAPAGPPRARTVDIGEMRCDVTVSARYRWMEGNDNPETTAFLRAQGAWTAAQLARIPGRDALLARIRELGHATGQSSGAQLAGSRLFYART